MVLVLRQGLQIICFYFERGALDQDVLNAGHAGRGELGADSLRLVEALLTVFMVLGRRTHLEWGDAITVSTSLMLWDKGRNWAELFRRQPRPPDGEK